MPCTPKEIEKCPGAQMTPATPCMQQPRVCGYTVYTATPWMQQLCVCGNTVYAAALSNSVLSHIF